MEDRSTQSLLQEQQEKSLFLFVVVVGYIITFVLASNGGTNYTTLQVLLGISFGAIYLSLIYFEAEILGRFSPNTKSLLFFSIQLLLVLGIGWLLGPGGNWLIGLPLVGVAVEWLSPRSRWYVYVGLIAAIVLPILHYSTWITAVMNAFVISAAIFFVAALTQSRINEQEARARAEELTVELEKANYRLAEYASQVEELAAAEERNRLAREIHDSVGHYLTIVNVQLEAAKVVFHSDPERALDALEKAHELVRKGLSSVRESVLALRVSPVENRPLEDAIRSVVEEARASGIKVDLKLHGTPKAVDDKTALALYRSAQEGLTNVRKHANAASAEIELDYSQPGLVCLSVRDDGMGAAETSGGFGLTGIRERAHLLGGKVEIQSQTGQGFCLDVTVPVVEETDL
jgi:signal transduction histidine kinase